MGLQFDLLPALTLRGRIILSAESTEIHTNLWKYKLYFTSN